VWRLPVIIAVNLRRMGCVLSRSVERALARLDRGNRYVQAAMRAIAVSAAPPPPSTALGTVLSVRVKPSTAGNVVRAIRRRVAGEYVHSIADM
jgi:hypothetical protein